MNSAFISGAIYYPTSADFQNLRFNIGNQILIPSRQMRDGDWRRGPLFQFLAHTCLKATISYSIMAP